MRQASRMIYVAGLALVAACGGGDKSANPPSPGPGRRGDPGAARDAGGSPVESTSVSGRGATAVTTPTASIDRTGSPRALFIGTSLTAGLGLADPGTQSWPAVIQQLADSAHVPLNVVNAGLSGETSAGALRRSDWLLREKYDMVVIETGANDGLRGLDPDTTAANIRGIIAKVHAADPSATVLVVQMESPTNMGPRYTRAFHELFGKVAAQAHVPLLPFLLQNVGGVARLNQGDGIHPTAEGARIAAHNVWPGIRAALKRG